MHPLVRLQRMVNADKHRHLIKMQTIGGPGIAIKDLGVTSVIQLDKYPIENGATYILRDYAPGELHLPISRERIELLETQPFRLGPVDEVQVELGGIFGGICVDGEPPTEQMAYIIQKTVEGVREIGRAVCDHFGYPDDGFPEQPKPPPITLP